jgi:two-component system sensor histidine kinase AlgZ
LASASEAASKESQAYLPDFCAAGAVLVIVLVAELVAIVLTLAAHTTPGTFLTELSTMSMFVLWFALLSAALLCRLRPFLEKLGPTQAFITSFLLLQLLVLVLAESSFRLAQYFGTLFIINDSHNTYLMRTFGISAIVVAMAMRYLYVASEWRRSIVLEAQARISALQALIRPHFLFNSMNTIASLTRSNPRQAEEAVEDLADLLRANLNSTKNRTTLKDELEVAAIYQRIEKLRLGDRLRVRWDIGDLPMRALIPSLTIQPLLENAIYHGIESLPDGGEVRVSGSRVDDNLRIEIRNPVAVNTTSHSDGNKMALANIQQRFDLAYDGNATVTVDESDQHFTVQLVFPCEERAR